MQKWRRRWPECWMRSRGQSGFCRCRAVQTAAGLAPAPAHPVAAGMSVQQGCAYPGARQTVKKRIRTPASCTTALLRCRSHSFAHAAAGAVLTDKLVCPSGAVNLHNMVCIASSCSRVLHNTTTQVVSRDQLRGLPLEGHTWHSAGLSIGHTTSSCSRSLAACVMMHNDCHISFRQAVCM